MAVYRHKCTIICQTVKPHNNVNMQDSPHCFDLVTNNVSS